MWHLHTVSYHSSLKMNEIMIQCYNFNTKCIRLSARSQTQPQWIQATSFLHMIAQEDKIQRTGRQIKGYQVTMEEGNPAWLWKCCRVWQCFPWDSRNCDLTALQSYRCNESRWIPQVNRGVFMVCECHLKENKIRPIMGNREFPRTLKEEPCFRG